MNFAFWHQLVKMLPYSKKLLRVRILRFCGYSMKYGGVASFGGTTEQSTKVSPQNSFFSQLAKFSPTKVSCSLTSSKSRSLNCLWTLAQFNQTCSLLVMTMLSYSYAICSMTTCWVS